METIKAVEMVRQIRDRQYELTKNMTIDEWMAHIHQTAKEVNAEALAFLKQRHPELPKELKFLDSLN
jgi:hypothetical protein